MSRLSFLVLAVALAASRSGAAAQDAPPEPPPPLPPADPAAAETAVPADPAPAPPPPPPPPPPQRYEGQIGADGEGQDPYAAPTYDSSAPDDAGQSEPFEMPPFSVRLDPFNWLLQGRLPLEIEVGVWKLLSVELVPEFVTSEDPPLRDFSSYEDGVTQHSNGLGPISGASLGLGVWLDGEPFEGYVIRAILTNYGYEYQAADDSGVIDRVTRTTRRLGVFFGSYRRWSFFTIGGGIGLSYELHQQERCDLRAQSTSDGTRIVADADADCDDELQVALDRRAVNVDDANGFLHPMYLDARFSVGFIID